MLSFNPDEGALSTGRDFIAQLSQRDLSLQIPINYVNVPGVSLSAACFADNVYEDDAAIKCISNLLAVGFRRLELDLYWDMTSRVWSLCPVQLGTANGILNVSTTSSSISVHSSSASLSSGQLTARDFMQFAPGLQLRQDNGTLPVSASMMQTPASASSEGTLTTTSNTSAAATGTVGGAAGIVLQIGPFSCTRTTNLDLFTNVLAAHLENTETSLNATTKYVILNIHATASASSPTGSAKRPSMDAMPSNGSLLSSFATNIPFLYTPTDLVQQRTHLTDWYDVISTKQPDPAYLQIMDAAGKQSTQGGWPNEAFVEFTRAKRLLVGFGRIDPQMNSYELQGDNALIFSPNYLQSAQQLTFDGAAVSNGCLFNSGVQTLEAANSSWATFGLQISQGDAAAAQASTVINCGVSPMLNASLGASADKVFEPYKAYAMSTIWGWAEGEPTNTIPQSSSSQDFRCVTLNATSGRWHTSDCGVGHYCACRNPLAPYKWTISSTKASYGKAGSDCAVNTTFDVPRTALENQHLLATWRRFGSPDTLLYLNLNDLSAPTCWVFGQNTTCPYLLSTKSSGDKQQLIVPIVSSILVIVIAALTVFVKCAANRQSSKRRRRRGDDGWDYEGVPS